MSFNQDELLKMFGVAPKAKVTTKVSTVTTPKPVFVGSSESFFVVDQFDLNTGKEIGNEIQIDDFAAADFFAAYYRQTPEQTNECRDPVRTKFLTDLLASSEYTSTRTQTKFNVLASRLAATEIAKVFATIQSNEDTDTQTSDIESMVAASNAASAANESVDELDACAKAFGLGCDNSPASNPQVALDRLQETFQAVQDDPGLRKIMNIAGAYRLSAQALQRRKTAHGRDDIVGITQDNDLSHLLSSELALLDPELEDIFYGKFAEGALACYDLQGVEKVGKGPIVVCVDESSSMLNDTGNGVTRIEQAKAFCLAMAWIARHQKRDCVLVAWADSRRGRYVKVTADNQREVLRWLADFEGGGTSLDCVCSEVPERWATFGLKKGKTDLIIISDGVVDASTRQVSEFNEWRTVEKASVVSVVIGTTSRGALEAISSKVFCVHSFEVGNPAIQECLSI